MAQSRGHVIVSTLNEISDHATALNAAAYISFACSALIELTRCDCVVWINGDAITEAQAFKHYADRLASHELPVLAWIRLSNMQSAPSKPGISSHAVRSHGLALFCEREVVLRSQHKSAAELAARAYDIANYLIANGPAIRDGDTIGQDATEQVTASFTDRIGNDRTAAIEMRF